MTQNQYLGGFTISQAVGQANQFFCGVRTFTRDELRAAVERGELSAQRTGGGHLRFGADALDDYLSKLAAPLVDPETVSVWSGFDAADRLRVLRFHQLGAELATATERDEQRRIEQDAIRADLEARAASAKTLGHVARAEYLERTVAALQSASLATAPA